jgi:hypothetical protein
VTPRRPPSRAPRREGSPSSPSSVESRATAVTGPRPDAETLTTLEEERKVLLDSLRDLEAEREAGEIDDDDYATLRDDYTARAAKVLRRIEAAKAPPPAVRSGRRSPLPRTVPENGPSRATSRKGSAPAASGRRRTALTVAVILGCRRLRA